MTRLLNHRQLLAFIAVAFVAVLVFAVLWFEAIDSPIQETVPVPSRVVETTTPDYCVAGVPEGFNSRCPDGLGDVRRTQMDLVALGAPSFESLLVTDARSRLREIEIQLGPGDAPIEVAVKNPTPVQFGASTGVALRSTTFARMLDSGRTRTVERPADCEDGCRVLLWLTLGRQFQDEHPDAEVLVFAGEDALVTIEELWAYPPGMYGV